MSNSDLILSLLLVTALGMQFALAKEGSKCRNATMDCDVNECCAGVSPKTLGVCQPQPQLGGTCHSRIRPGAKICPCVIGTTCLKETYFRRDSILGKLNLDKIKPVYRCAPVPTQSPDEEEEE